LNLVRPMHPRMRVREDSASRIVQRRMHEKQRIQGSMT
jgi:hypothetical protein